MNQSQVTIASGVSAARLAIAYGELFPREFDQRDLPQLEHTMGNWLERFQENPAKTIATANWAGKVTQALFRALGLKQPKTKAAMLELLRDPPKAVRLVEYTLDYVHRVQVAVPSVSDMDAVAIAEQAFNDATIWDDTPEMPLLYDDFEESQDNTLRFEVVDVVGCMDDLPPRDGSVAALRQRASARLACRLLLQLCDEAKQSGKLSIGLDDLAAACDAARGADTATACAG